MWEQPVPTVRQRFLDGAGTGKGRDSCFRRREPRVTVLYTE